MNKKRKYVLIILLLVAILISSLVYFRYFNENNRDKCKLNSLLGLSNKYNISNVRFKKLWYADASTCYIVISFFEINNVCFNRLIEDLNLKQPNDICVDSNPNLFVFYKDEEISDYVISHFWSMKSQYNSFSNINNLNDFEWWNPDTTNFEENYSTFFNTKEKTSKMDIIEADSRLTIQRKSNKTYLILELTKLRSHHKLLRGDSIINL